MTSTARRALAALLLATFAPAANAGVNCWAVVSQMPVRRSNNAVAYFEREGSPYLISCLGIDETKLYSGIQNDAWIYDIDGDMWTQAPDVPGRERIAASASTLRGKVWVIGGYDVAANGTETSHDDVVVYDPATGEWTEGPSAPRPIDDHVQVVREDRWIYIVSGWSNTATSRAVQVFDAETNEWRTSPQQYPIGLFGHSGCVAGNSIMVFDGVADIGQFRLLNLAIRGVIDPDNPASITWRDMRPDGAHDGLSGYRMAVVALPGGRPLLIGGTHNPYNYDGVGYNGQPSNPLDRALPLDPANADDLSLELRCANPPPVPVMDLRNMAWSGSYEPGENFYWVVGGMTENQEVTDVVQRLDASELFPAPPAPTGIAAR